MREGREDMVEGREDMGEGREDMPRFYDFGRFPGRKDTPKVAPWDPCWDTFLYSGEFDREKGGP